MTKRKPDSVTEFRISLQAKQSEQLDALITAVQVRAFAAPLVNILSSPVAMLGIIGMILALASKYLGPGWEEKVEGKTQEQIRDWMEAENIIIGGLFAVVFGILFKSPWTGFATGVAVVEGLEAGMGPDWTSEEQTEENQKVLGAYAVKALSELNIFASKLRDAV